MSNYRNSTNREGLMIFVLFVAFVAFIIAVTESLTLKDNLEDYKQITGFSLDSLKEQKDSCEKNIPRNQECISVITFKVINKP